MTGEEKAEEYLRKGVCQGCSSICEGDCAYAKPVRQAYLDGLAEGERIGKEKQWIATGKAQKKTSTKIKDLEKENQKLSKMLNIAIMDRCLWTSDGDIQKETTEYRAELERRVVKMLEA